MRSSGDYMSVDDKEGYIRVTSTLYPFSGLDKINPEVLSHAAERGTKVHKICEGIITGLGEYGVDDETEPYVSSFKQWWDKGHTVVAVEKRFWDDERHITGQVDLILQTEDGLVIADLKTSSKPSKTWPVQGSAYAHLARKSGYDIKKLFFIHLLRTGKEAKVYEYDISEEFFLSTYKVWDYFFNKDKS